MTFIIYRGFIYAYCDFLGVTRKFGDFMGGED
jgi:hypothetical protein